MPQTVVVKITELNDIQKYFSKIAQKTCQENFSEIQEKR